MSARRPTKNNAKPEDAGALRGDKGETPPPSTLARLTPPPGWTHADLVDEWNDRASRRQLCMSVEAAELAAVDDVMAMCEKETHA